MVQQLDASQNVLSTGLYDAWGGRLQGANPGPFGYDGQWGYYTDGETGLILLTHRYYDPTEGRFLNRDPIGYNTEVNLYGYVGNTPTHFFDPLGLWGIGIGVPGWFPWKHYWGGIVIGDPNNLNFCLGDCSNPSFGFGGPGWGSGLSHSYRRWGNCLKNCMIGKLIGYGIGVVGGSIINGKRCWKWFPGGSGGGGKWKWLPPGEWDWGGIWNDIKGGALFAFDVALLQCEYECASKHAF